MPSPIIGRRWTSEEDEKLRTLWATTPARQIAEVVKRSEEAVRQRAQTLRLPYRWVPRPNVWSTEDVSILKSEWLRSTSAEIGAKVGRSAEAVEQKARMLRLERPTGADRHWSAKEVETLRWMWAESPVEAIAEALGRTRVSVINKATSLSLGGLRRAGKSVAQIARETGYEHSTIRKVMRNLGMKPRRLFRGERKGSKPRDFCIEVEAEERIIAYLKEHGRKKIFPHHGARTPGGMWGVGKKPPECLTCKRVDRPHYAKGKCKYCYGLALKAASATAAE